MTDILPHEWLRTHAEADADAPAVVFAGTTLSYGQLDERADRRAEQLKSSGVGAGVLVAVDAASHPRTIVDLVAIARSGGVAVPVGPNRIEHDQRVEDDVFVVVPTSGSSGSPRGVILTKQNVASAVGASRRRLGNDSTDRWLLTLPLFHVGGLAVVWRSLSAGGSIHLLARFETEAAVAALHDRSVTMASLVPTMLHRILHHDPGPYNGLRSVLLGGASTTAGLVRRALDAGLPILQTYGMTETASQLATVEPGTALEALGTAGPPLHDVDVSFDEGEILVDGPTVSPGYLGEPPRQAALRTGDLGYLDPGGRLVVVGRKDDVIITGGENIHPAAIEAVIERLPAVGQAVVVGVPDDEWGQAVVAIVEAAPSELKEIECVVRSLVARAEVPRRWVAVRHLPLLANGKPDRDAARVLAVTADL